MKFKPTINKIPEEVEDNLISQTTGAMKMDIAQEMNSLHVLGIIGKRQVILEKLHRLQIEDIQYEPTSQDRLSVEVNDDKSIGLILNTLNAHTSRQYCAREGTIC
jgi:hypothetical protein